MICEHCGKEHDGSFGSGRFCCRSCANSRKITQDVREHISNGLKKYYKPLKKQKQYFCGSIELNNKYPEISNHQSSKWFNKLIPFGLDITTLYTENFINEYYKVKDLLYNEYVVNKLSPKDIFNKYNCSLYINNSETLLHLFKCYGFPIRNGSKAITNAYLQGKLKGFANNPHPYGHEQWHKTWNDKDVYLRSNLELKYAKYLDLNKIKYDVEFLRIKYFDSQQNKIRCAIPDFYIFETNTIVEIKSRNTLDIQNMKDKFISYKNLGYNTKLILDNKEVDLYKLNTKKH